MHINHRRGETREFVFRRWEGPRRGWAGSKSRHLGRKGLLKRYSTLAHDMGARNFCPCCAGSYPLRTRGGRKDKLTTRRVNRLDRQYGRSLCEDWDQD